MKLLYCPLCTDVRKLNYEDLKTVCDCGKSYGYYHADGWNATIGGAGLAIGLSNPHVKSAVYCRMALDDKEDIDLKAWLMKPSHPRINWKDREWLS